MATEYKLLNIPKLGAELIAARVPRVQPSAQSHFVDHLSWMVSSDMWTVDPTSGNPLSYKGKTLEEEAEHWIEERPNALMPVELVDTSGECWTTGNITLQGQRLKELRAFCGSDAAAMVMFQEEAAAYGTKPGSTAKGVKVEKADKAGKKPGSPGNPWDKDYWKGGDEDARQAAMLSIIRSSTERARTMSKSVGCRIDGRPL
jgi:hypothetical protein